jgi:hypothetical protein
MGRRGKWSGCYKEYDELESERVLILWAFDQRIAIGLLLVLLYLLCVVSMIR